MRTQPLNYFFDELRKLARMNPRSFCQLAARLLHHPAIAYHEHLVRAEVEQLCIEHALELERDKFGNTLVRLRTDSRLRPLVLAAHLDHPGFELIRRLSDKTWLARFRGGVPDNYFRRGVSLTLMPGGSAARLGERKDQRQKVFEIRATRPTASRPEFAVWGLDDYALRGGSIHARACDDLIGAASVLATLIELKRSRAKVHVIGVLSRAEEVGFHGALVLATARKLPRNSLVVSLETSRELPGVKMGQGVILRVGDRASIFDSRASRYLNEVAAGLVLKKKGFLFQRALMSGGTCEATAYQEFGYQSAAVCVALGNYHNCGEANRIKAEYVSVADACHMVDLLVEAARQISNYNRLIKKLPQRLNKLLREAQTKLKMTASG